MRPSIELNYLKYFYYAVREGGVSPAADRLCVQQPVVSKMIRNLEAQFGRPLFAKKGRKNSLTDFGQLVFRHCQSIFNELEVVSRLDAARDELKGSINIGATEVIATHLLADPIVELRRRFERVHFNVYTSTATQMMEMIQSGSMLCGFFFHAPTLPANCEIVSKTKTAFRLVVATKLRKNTEILESFIGSREIDDLSNQKFPTVELLRQHFPNTAIRFSSNHLTLHREMVLRGEGVAILPEFLVAQDIRARKLCDVFPGRSFPFDRKLVARKGENLHPVVSYLAGI